MDISKCNHNRHRSLMPVPRICAVCGLGPCKFYSGEKPIMPGGPLPLDAFTVDPNDLRDAIAYSMHVDRPARIPASPPHHPKMVVQAIALEKIEAGDAIRVETDLITGMTYARKA